jgi:hypothetical protein
MGKSMVKKNQKVGAKRGGVATYIYYTILYILVCQKNTEKRGRHVNIFLSHCKDDFIVDLGLLLPGMWMTT